MSKKKVSKSFAHKYLAVLNKFGVVPNFDFEDHEKKIVKSLGKDGVIDFLDFCDRYDLKPGKAKKVIDSLVAKGAIEFQNDEISLTPSCVAYLHTTKKQRKSAKKFRKFVDALSEKDLDEFMKLVSAFEVNPDAEEAPAEEPAPVEETPVEESKPEEEPKPKKAPTKRKATSKAKKPKLTSKPKVEEPAPVEEAPAEEPAPTEEAPAEESKEEPVEETTIEENKTEENPNGEEV